MFQFTQKKSLQHEWLILLPQAWPDAGDIHHPFSYTPEFLVPIKVKTKQNLEWEDDNEKR